MENRKGSGIFLGVVGVATLVVAIIGATFAYFSASASNNNAITGATAEAGNLTLAVTRLDQTTGGLIPMDEELESTALSATPKGCIDANGNTVCHVYQIALTNGPSPVKISGTLEFAASTTTNIVYDITDINETTTKGIATLTANNTATAHTSEGTLATSISFEHDETKYYYVVVWLNETGEKQDDEAGKTNAYTGTVTFEAVGANGVKGVTATFTAS